MKNESGRQNVLRHSAGVPPRKAGTEHYRETFAALNRKCFLVKITLLFPLNLQTHNMLSTTDNSNNSGFPTHPAGLIRIILIDSYIGSAENRIFEFDFENHTQVNGANGSGKTSLLKLIPLFYGLVPGRITSSSNVRKSFSGFYLPRSDSTLVFEYYNSRGEIVHVMMTNAGNSQNSKSLSYRFIKAPFSIEDIVVYDESRKCYRAREWKEYRQILRDRGVQTEALVNTVDQYRSVIQNISTGANNNLRYDYSLSGGLKQLRYIESITHSLITGHVKFDSIKLLLSDILRQDHPGVALTLDPAKVLEWCSDIDDYRAAEKERESLETVSLLGEKIADNKKLLREQAGQLAWYRHSFKVSLKQLAQDKEAAQMKKKEKEKAWNQRNRDLEQENDSVSARLAGVRQIIRGIEEKQTAYEEQDMATWLQEYRNLPALRNSLNEDNNKLGSVKNVYSNIKTEFDNKKLSAESAANREIARIKENQNACQQTFLEQMHTLEKNHQGNLSKLENSRQSRLSDLRIQENNARNRISNLEREKGNIIPPEHLLKSRNDIQEEINTLSQSNAAISASLYRLSQEIQNHERNLTRLGSEAEKNARAESECGLRLREIEALLNPDSGMLTEYLNEYCPEWRDGIGRVLREDLLLRNDLNPEAFQGSEDRPGRISVGSVSLDIRDLPRCQKNNQDLLTEKQQLQERLTNCLRITEENAEAQKKTQKSLEEALSEKFRLESKLISEETFAGCRDRLVMAESSIENYRRERLLELTNALNAAKKELSQILGSMKSLEEEHARLRENAVNNYLSSKSDLETEHEAATRDFTAKTEQIKAEIKKTVADYEEIMQKKLANENVDARLIDLIQNEITKKENLIQEITNRKPEIEKYETWLENSYSQLPEYRQQESSLESHLCDVNNRIADARKEIDQATALLDREIQNIGDEIKVQETNDESAEKLLSALNDIHIHPWPDAVNQEAPARVFADTATSARLTLNSLRKNQNDLKERIGKITLTMNGMTSKIKDYWVSCLNDARNQARLSGIDINDDQNQEADEFSYPMAAQQLLNHGLPQHRKCILDQARDVLHMIKQYYDQMRDFDDRIRAFSRRISRIVSDNLQFEAFEEFSVTLEPRIKNVAGWDFIEELSRFYAKWQEEGKIQSELPNPEVSGRLKSLANLFINGELRNDLNDLFSIVFTVTENGKKKTAQTEKELEDISSNGLTFLLLCALYISLIHESRGNRNIAIHWPVDEMSKLSGKNIRLLLDVMKRNKIVMVSAAPDLSAAVAAEFSRIYRIAKDRVYVNQDALDPVGSAIRNRLRAKAEGESQ